MLLSMWTAIAHMLHVQTVLTKLGHLNRVNVEINIPAPRSKHIYIYIYMYVHMGHMGIKSTINPSYGSSKPTSRSRTGAPPTVIAMNETTEKRLEDLLSPSTRSRIGFIFVYDATSRAGDRSSPVVRRER